MPAFANVFALALVALSLASTAKAACPIRAKVPVGMSGNVISIGETTYRLNNGTERARLTGILAACDMGAAAMMLSDYGDARRKVLVRAGVSLLVWPVGFFTIPPAVKASQTRRALQAAFDQYGQPSK